MCLSPAVIDERVDRLSALLATLRTVTITKEEGGVDDAYKVSTRVLPDVSPMILKRDLPEYGLHAGAFGTVVYVYDAETVEIHFVTDAGNILVTVALADLDREIDASAAEKPKQ